MVKEDAVIKYAAAVGNRNRIEIIELLKKNPDLNISEIAEKVNLAYKNVLNHIRILEDAGLIETEKQEKTQGREVIVRYRGEDHESEWSAFRSFLRNPFKSNKKFHDARRAIHKYDGLTIDEIAIKSGLKPSDIWEAYEPFMRFRAVAKEIDKTKTIIHLSDKGRKLLEKQLKIK